jgi:hypothetical protein
MKGPPHVADLAPGDDLPVCFPDQPQVALVRRAGAVEALVPADIAGVRRLDGGADGGQARVVAIPEGPQHAGGHGRKDSGSTCCDVSEDVLHAYSRAQPATWSGRCSSQSSFWETNNRLTD